MASRRRTPRRSSQIRERSSGRPGEQGAALFVSLLVLLFLGLTVYASVQLYQAARAAAQQLPPLALPLSLPWDRWLGWGRTASESPLTEGLSGQTGAGPGQPGLSVLQEKRINILLVGVDKRPQESGPPRTDTLILVSVAPETKEVSMISIPRDLWVPIPGYNVNAKINQAYGIGELRGYPGGGPALLKRTVSELTGYPVHYYAMVDFNGFRTLIDLIGGIEVCVPYTIHDEQFPTDNYGVETLHIEAGCQHMDGELALKYVRTRHADSDYARARRQQQVLLAVRDKVLQARMLPTLLMRAPQILRSLTGSLETDIPLDQLVALARLASDIEEDHIRREVIDNRYGRETYAANGAWILVPDREKLRPLFDSMLAPRVRVENHETQAANPTPASSTSPPSYANENALIVVFNGTGRPGYAAQLASWLESQGFRVVQFADLEGPPYAHSVLVIHTDRPATRQALVERFHIQPENIRYSENFISNVDMELFVGADFTLPASAQTTAGGE